MAREVIVKRLSMVTLVEDYLTMRRQLGFALKVQGHQLLRFGRFADDYGHQGPITLELAVQWARSNTQKSSKKGKSHRKPVDREDVTGPRLSRWMIPMKSQS